MSGKPRILLIEDEKLIRRFVREQRTTNTDRTNYFQNVPTTALDTALFMESDRMGYLLAAIDQKRLDTQRGVVQNEKRQGENQPYGRSYDALTRSLYPVGHPYHHTVIGSMEDLNAASLDDVKAAVDAGAPRVPRTNAAARAPGRRARGAVARDRRRRPGRNGATAR